MKEQINEVSMYRAAQARKEWYMKTKFVDIVFENISKFNFHLIFQKIYSSFSLYK